MAERSLDGEWGIWFDDRGEFVKKAWIAEFLGEARPAAEIPWARMARRFRRAGRRIRVPSTWESLRPGWRGEAWHWRALPRAAPAPGRRVFLRFEAVRFGAEVFVNGRRAGAHLGPYTPFEFEITDLLDARGGGDVAVRVLNPGGGEEGYHHSLYLEGVRVPVSRDFGGIWQTVSLRSFRGGRIVSVFAIPRLRERRVALEVEWELWGEGARGRIEAEILAPRGARPAARRAAEIAPAAASRGGLRTSKTLLEFDLPRPLPWTVETPSLYRAKVRLVSGQGRTLDRAAVRFGMRDFTVEGKEFLLNGEPFFFKSCIHHQFEPGSVAGPRTRLLARGEVAAAKRMGLNALHVHRHAGHPWLIEEADRQGLALYQEPGGAIFGTTHGPDHPGVKIFTAQLRELIRRDRNHPSILAWGISNEQWLNEEARRTLMLLARGLDPTRVVCDDSGQGRALLPAFSRRERPWIDTHFYPPAPVDDETLGRCARFGRPDGPTVIGEIGYGGLPDLPACVRAFRRLREPGVEGRLWERALREVESGLRRHGILREFGGASGFCRATQALQAEAVTELVAAVRSNPRVNGFGVACFHDNAIWFQGMLDIFRNEKPAARALAEAARADLLSLRVSPSPFSAGGAVGIRVDLVREKPSAGRGVLRVRALDPSGRAVLDERRAVRWPGRARVTADLAGWNAPLDGPTGDYGFEAELLAAGRVLARGRTGAYGLRPEEAVHPPGGFSVWDASARKILLPYLIERKVPHEPWSGGPFRGGLLCAVEVETWHMGQAGGRILREVDEMERRVREGGTAILFLGRPFLFTPGEPFFSRLKQKGALPEGLALVQTHGHFQGCYHWTRRHPVFDGLPAPAVAAHAYRNIVPRLSLAGCPGEILSGCNFNGFSWFADLAAVPHGKGRFILCTWRLKGDLFFYPAAGSGTLGLDPAANRLFANLVSWAARFRRAR